MLRESLEVAGVSESSHGSDIVTVCSRESGRE